MLCRSRRLRPIWVVLSGIAAMAALAPGAVTAATPTVPEQKLRTALHCDRQLSKARTKPVLLLPGTGSQGSYLYLRVSGRPARQAGAELLPGPSLRHHRRHAGFGPIRRL